MKLLSPLNKKSSSFSQRLMTWAAIFVIIISVIVIYSETAHAGLISYMNTMLGGNQASAKINQAQARNSSQSIALLQAASNFDPNPEKASGLSPIVGDTLVADAALSESASGDTTNTQISTYVVREGDTITGIAKMFGVTPNTIVWANDISLKSALPVGKTLIILPVTGYNYVVKSGDTINGIVLKYKGDLDEILRYNGLSLNSKLVAGQTILIPDAELQTSVPTKNPGKSASYAGYYIRPIVGGTKTQGIHGHNGVDLASAYGTPILASAAGKVIVSLSSGWNGGYGNMVVISHDNGTQTLYAHLSKNLVSVGQRVDQGQKIALMGATGEVVGLTGVHLHFEIRNGPVNMF